MKGLAFLLIAVAAAAFVAGGELNPKTVPDSLKPFSLDVGEAMEAGILVPAVDENNEGVVTSVSVRVVQGTGQTLASIDDILFFTDTQNSIRTAKHVAQDITGLDLSDKDIVYTITADASVIEGPSAGAALTIATIAALQGSRLRNDVFITGTVEPDGAIGKVGKVDEKAAAARDNGASLLLIPEGSGLFSETFEYERVTECRYVGDIELCESSYEKKPASSLGVEIKEVSTIRDALKYFLEEA